MSTTKKTKFQRIEVSTAGETIRSFRKTNEADAVAFALEISRTSARSVVVDAVSSHGSTGQTSHCVAICVRGERLRCAA